MFKHITGNVYLLEDPHEARIPFCHCLYIDDEKKALIDSSSGRDLVSALQGKRVDLLITSHYHEDHILNHDAFPEAKIWCHYLDAPGVRSRQGFKSMYGFEIFGEQEMGEKFVRGFGLKDYRVDAEFTDGYVFDLGQTRVEVVHLPGHTPGHSGFYFPDHNILFVGDIDLSSFGPWYGNPVSDVDEFISSIKRIKEMKPDILITSHKGLVKDNVNARLDAYLQRIYEHDEDILKALNRPKSLSELASANIIYGKPHEPYRLYQFFEKMSLLVHLRRLIRLGLVEMGDGVYYKK